MFEGRSNTGGWSIVAIAVIALVAFTGLLYVRGGSGPPLQLSGSASSPRPSGSPAASAKPGSSAVAGGSAKPGASRSPGSSPAPSGASPTAVVAGATSDPNATPARTPRATKSATPTTEATDEPTASADSGAPFKLPRSPQSASVTLSNGQGDCPDYPTEAIASTSFTLTSGDRLAARSPSNQRLTGRVKPDGSFSLAGASPVERWVGTLTDSGGSGSYFIVVNGCTEGYETTITFD